MREALPSAEITQLISIGDSNGEMRAVHSLAERFLVPKVVAKQTVMAVAGGAAVGTSNGVDSAASSLAAEDEKTRKVMKSIVKATCAFGNSVTLPLIFFSTLLTGAQVGSLSIELHCGGGSTGDAPHL